MSEEIHLEILERLAGRQAQYNRVGEIVDGPVIHTAHWEGFPESGLLSGFTVGLSAHPRWGHGLAPELILSVESNDLSWIFAMGVIAEEAGADFSFDVGETINFGGRISKDSEMRAFIIMHQMMLPKDYDVLKTRRGPVALRQLVPLYRAELELIRADGPASFISQEPEPASVVREPISR